MYGIRYGFLERIWYSRYIAALVAGVPDDRLVPILGTIGELQLSVAMGYPASHRRQCGAAVRETKTNHVTGGIFDPCSILGATTSAMSRWYGNRIEDYCSIMRSTYQRRRRIMMSRTKTRLNISCNCYIIVDNYTLTLLKSFNVP